MSEQPKWYPSQRVDLPHFRHATAEFPLDTRNEVLRQLYGAGVVDGFRIEVLDQSGPDKGKIRIYNGRGIDWSGQFLNDQTGTIAQDVNLPSQATEYWIEIEIVWIEAAPDSVGFYDSTITNTPPLPNGQEVNVPRVYTRQVPAWRVRQPMNNNPTGKREDAGYTPAHFSPSTEELIPVAVLRTNATGQVVSGDPDTDEYGNDLVSVVTPTGTKQFVKIAGMNETRKFDPPASDIPVVYGRKFSDQRPNFANPLSPMFLSSEMATGTYSGSWARDMQSQFDHLATLIQQVKEGAGQVGGQGDVGHFHLAQLDTVDPDWLHVDMKYVLDNNSPAAAMLADPDQFIGCTLRFVTGEWQGFYAEVRGNDRTDGGTGVTRLYLGRKTLPPEWRELPSGNPFCQIMQHRNENYVDPPTPTTGFRGLNALDEEVYSARTDWWSGQAFDNLRARLNAGKLATVTVAPVDTKDPDTGEPNSSLTPRADYFESLSDIRTQVQNAAQKGGLIHFRRGTYTFDGIAPASTVFSLLSTSSLIIEGEGTHNTILEFNYNNANPAAISGTMFSMQTCYVVEFRNMTIRTKGTPFSCTGCAGVRFVNCTIESEYDGTITTPTAAFGSANQFMFVNCDFYVQGGGVTFTQFLDSHMQHCRFWVRNQDKTKLDKILELGLVGRGSLEHIYLEGFPTTAGIEAGSCDFLSMSHIKGKVNTDIDGAKIVLGDVARSSFGDVNLAQLVSDTNTTYGFKCLSLSYSFFKQFNTQNVQNGVYCSGTMLDSFMGEIELKLTTGGFGVYVKEIKDGLIDKATIFISGGGASTGIEVQKVTNGSITRNTVIGDAGEILYGIRVTGNNQSGLFIDHNNIQNSRYGIYFNNLGPSSLLSICDNQTFGGGSSDGAGLWFNFSSSIRYLKILRNQVADNNGFGFTADATGCDFHYCQIDENDFYGVVRGLELWSSSGGSLTQCSISGNTCTSVDYAPMVVGADAHKAVPRSAGAAFSINNSDIENNKIKVLSNACVGGLFLSKTVSSSLSWNKVFGDPAEWAMGLGEMFWAQIVGNNIAYDTSNGHGIVFMDKHISHSMVALNRVRVLGAHFGIYMPSSVLGGNHAENNYLGNMVWCDNTAGSRCYSLPKMGGCNLNGNTAYGGAWGFHAHDCNENHWSGNFAHVKLTSLYIGFDLTGGTLNNSGHLTQIIAGIPGYTGAGWPASPLFINDGPPSSNDVAMCNYVDNL